METAQKSLADLVLNTIGRFEHSRMVLREILTTLSNDEEQQLAIETDSALNLHFALSNADKCLSELFNVWYSTHNIDGTKKSDGEDDDDIERNEFGDELVVGCAKCGNDVHSTNNDGHCKKCAK